MQIVILNRYFEIDIIPQDKGIQVTATRTWVRFLELVRGKKLYFDLPTILPLKKKKVTA